MSKRFSKLNKFPLKKIFTFVLIIVILGGVVPQQLAFSMSSFTSPKTLAGIVDKGSQQIAAAGSNVYVVYEDNAGTDQGAVFFKNSTDNGNTFKGNALQLNTANDGTTPQVAVDSSGKVYVVWANAADGEIYFRNSTDVSKPWTFHAAAKIISNLSGAGNGFNPRIAVGSSKIFIGWESDNGKVSFTSTTDGITFAPIINVSTNPDVSNSLNFVMNATGSSVYFAWTEPTGVSTNDKIMFRNSTDNGASFKGSAINLSGSIDNSINPVLSTSGNDVYIAWQGVTNSNPNEVYFESGNANSGSFVLNAANGGTHGTAGTPRNLSNNVYDSITPKIASSGTNTFVIWDDKHSGGTPADIRFKKISSEGTDLSSSVINLSSDTGASLNPDMAVSGSNIFVAWQDNVLNLGQRPSDSSHTQLFFKSSEDGGSTFSGFQNFTSSSGISNGLAPHLATAGTHSYVVWNDNSANTDLKFRAGNILPQSQTVSTPFDFRFDATQYRPNATATITLLNTTAWNSVSTLPVTVFSTSSGSSVAVTLSKTSTTGQFSGTITTTNATSVPAGQLKVHGGDAIIARFDAGSAGKQNATASIFKSKIDTDFTSYKTSDILHVQVTDPSSNLDPSTVDTITVNVKSGANPSGANIVLSETDKDTGIFGGLSGSSASKIYIGASATSLLPTSGTATVTTTYAGTSVNPGCPALNISSPDTLQVQVNSTSDSTGFTTSLTETGDNTQTFSGTIGFSTTATNSATNTIKVQSGDVVTILNKACTGVGFGKSYYLVDPPTANSGIIGVTSIPDTVTISYNGLSKSVAVNTQSGEGGGGGGIVRVGLVLNVVASLGKGGSNSIAPSFSLDTLAAVPGNLPENIRQQILNQDPNKPLEPQHDNFEYPVSIDDGGYLLGRYSNKIDTVTEKTNTPVNLKLNIPATNLQHLALYTNLHGTENDLTKSDTYIIYEKGQPLQIVDPHHYFDHVQFDLTTEGIKNKIAYGITFANPMDKSNIILRTWNDRHASNDVVLLDAWQVVDNQKLTSQSISSPLQQQQPLQKTVSEPQIESKVPSWVKNNVKLWNAGSIGDTEFETGIQYLISEKIINVQKQSLEPTETNTIPKWVKNTAGFWANGDVSEDEFLHGIEYLVKIGLIKVS